MPHRDLWLSPDHAVFIDGVLIPVKYLIDGTSVARVAVDEVSYHHIELARHDVLLAEGLAAESYLDTGDRAAFTNGGGVRPSHPASAVLMWEASGCAPIVVGGPVLTAARRRLAARRAIGPSRAAGSRAHRDHAGMNAAGLPVVRSAGDAQFPRLDLQREHLREDAALRQPAGDGTTGPAVRSAATCRAVRLPSSKPQTGPMRSAIASPRSRRAAAAWPS